MDKFDWKLKIHINILILRLVGLWPKNNLYKSNFYTLYAFISINLFINAHNFFQAANILFVYKDLAALTAIIFVTFTDLLSSVKAYYYVRNMNILRRLMSDLEEEIFQPKRVEQRLLVQQGLDQWRLTYVAFWVPVGTTLLLWAIFPVMDGSFKEYRLPFSAWYPYNTKVSPLYEITYVYQVISIWFLATANLNMDTMVAALMACVGCQCEILCDKMKRLFGCDAGTTFGRELVDCIRHHKKILSFAENCNTFFDKIVLGQFFTSSVSLALAMFQLTLVQPLSSEFYSLLFYVGSISVQIFLYCWFGNEVEVKVRVLVEVLYLSVLNSGYWLL